MQQAQEKNQSLEKETPKLSEKQKFIFNTKNLSSEDKKIFYEVLQKANEKTLGDEVKVLDIYLHAIKKLTEKDFKELHRKSLSDDDLLRLAWENHKKKHGEVTFKRFLVDRINVREKDIFSSVVQ